METLHLCYALHDPSGRYTKFLGTSLASVLAHASGPVCVHVLLDATVSEENRARLQQVTDVHGGATVVFHDMDALFRRPLRRLALVRPDIARGRCTVATYYRLFLPTLLPSMRVLYLDADTVVTCDVRSVYDGSVGACGLAARTEPLAEEHLMPSSRGVVTPSRFFNAGVLLFDFAVLVGGTDGSLTEMWLDFLAAHPKEPYNDQDLLNHFYSTSYGALPPAAHMLVPERQRRGIQETPPGIYHFDAMSLGMFRPDDAYDRLFYTYFAQTPWCDGAFLLRAFSAIRDASSAPVPEAYGAQLIRAL